MSFTKYRNITNLKNTDPIDPALLAEVRAYLSMRYERRLENKLAGRLPVNLRTIPSTTGTSEESASTYMTFSEDQVKGAIGDIFLNSNGRLLLLGAPGVGKTTLVLQLAQFLLDRQGLSMPVVLNLATWRSEFETFDNWLSAILPAELAVFPRFAKKIRSSIPLILLLDGLDEVPEADRATCLEAIGEYGSTSKHQFLISSRIGEYSATKDAPVNTQRQVEQLTIEQVEMALMATAHLESGSSRLLHALKIDPLLRDSIENPFYLNTAQLLFSKGKKWSDFGFTALDIPGRQQEILLSFIRNTLQRKEKKDYPLEKSERWLSFLASRMNRRNMVVFELIDLQYYWWRLNRWENIQANIIFAMVLGLRAALFPVLFLSLVFGLVPFLIFGSIGTILPTILYFMALVPVFGLVAGLRNRSVYIFTGGSINWSWKNYLKSIKSSLKDHMIHFIAVGLILGLILGLVTARGGVDLAVGLILGLVFGLIFGLVLDLISGLVFGLGDLMQNSTSIIQITSPYHRFNASKRALRFSILQHKHLCYLLRKKERDALPPDLVQFLNELSLRHILEFDGDPATGKGGGSWRFRHRILQEYFAEKWVEGDTSNLK